MESFTYANESNCRKCRMAPGEKMVISAGLHWSKSHLDEVGLPNKS